MRYGWHYLQRRRRTSQKRTENEGNIHRRLIFRKEQIDGQARCEKILRTKTLITLGLLSIDQKPKNYIKRGIDMSASLDFLRELNILSLAVRLGLAMICGGLIGLERERKRRPAGFRTYMLVCLGASLTMLLSQYLYVMSESNWSEVVTATGIKMDVSRVGAQVINGIGFLGAGTIIVTGKHEVKGLTTAAGLWASACMGLAVGAGFYECVVLGFLLIVLSIILLPYVENIIVANTRNMILYVELKNLDEIGGIIRFVKDDTAAIYDLSIDRGETGRTDNIAMNLTLRLKDKHSRSALLSALAGMEQVTLVEEL